MKYLPNPVTINLRNKADILNNRLKTICIRARLVIPFIVHSPPFKIKVSQQNLDRSAIRKKAS